jgi:hypothetical protein
MAVSITYNEYEITRLDGAYDWSENEDTFNVSIEFVIQANDFASVEAAIEAAEEKLREPDKDFKLVEGGTTRWDTSQTNHTQGFNAKPSFQRLTGEGKTEGTLNFFRFTIMLNKPADYKSATNAFFKEGGDDLQCSVKRPFSNIHTLTFSGRWKVVSTSKNAAIVNYLAKIQTIINTVYLSVYYAGKTWDILTDDPTFDRSNKTLQFSITYRQRAVAYTGSGGTKYILQSLNLQRSISRQIAMPQSFEQSRSGTAGSHKTIQADQLKPSYAYANQIGEPPVDYTIQGSVSIDIESLERSAAISLWKSEIRNWVKGILNSCYGSNISYFETESLNYDAHNSMLNFDLKAIELAQGNLFSLTIKYDDDEDEGEVYEPVASAKKYSKIIYANDPKLMKTVSISAITINRKLDDKFFEAFLPPEFNEKTGTGWRRYHRKTGNEINRKKTIDTSVIVYVKSKTYNLIYLENCTRIVQSGAIIDSAKPRG